MANINNIPINFSQLKPGDKIYEYDFCGGCSMIERTVKSVKEPNECGYCEIWFEESSYTKMFFADYFLMYDDDKSLEIWTTIGSLREMFSAVFRKGIEHNQGTIRMALGIDD